MVIHPLDGVEYKNAGTGEPFESVTSPARRQDPDTLDIHQNCPNTRRE